MLHRKRVLAAKIEATPGTAESLTASEGAFNVQDAVIQPETEFIQRMGQSAFSPLPGSIGAESGVATFTIEACGSGNAETPKPAWATTFLPACGLVATDNAYAPVSEGPSAAGDVKTVTIGMYEDGLFKSIKGAMGSAVLTLIAGQLAKIEFTFRGLWVPPSDVALIAPTYPTVKPPRFVSASLLVGGAWSPRVQQLTFDLGNDVQMREDANTAEGYFTAMITDRLSVGSINPETVLVATYDVHNKWRSLTEQSLAWQLGAGSDGNTLAFSGTKAQFTSVQEGERNKIAIEDVGYQMNRVAAAGDDEYTLTFS